MDDIQVSLENEQPINVTIVEETPIQVSLIGEIGMKGDTGESVKGDKGEKGDQGIQGDPLSFPPEGCFKVTNIYVNANGKLVVSYSDNPA